MCGRYALNIRPGAVRSRLVENDYQVDSWPDDDDVRHTYNFAPGSHGLVYRADVPDAGAGYHDKNTNAQDTNEKDGAETREEAHTVDATPEADETRSSTQKYKLTAAKWGLIPHWTKRKPDYGSMMKTINARDDSLANTGGMWATMKTRKRCIVIAEGFFEWYKKDGGRTKIPHYIKRKDGQLMLFAGLWDVASWDGERVSSYTIITTSSNKQLGWLHDRMPVILEGEQVKTWLDPSKTEWTAELQGLLKPYVGELECYPVDQAVGKVGNNSPSFVVPVDSKENKKNIANFFGPKDAKKEAKTDSIKQESTPDHVKKENTDAVETTQEKGVKPEHVDSDQEVEGTESNAPLPHGEEVRGIKREASPDDQTPPHKASKADKSDKPTAPSTSTRKTRSATSNTNNKPFKSPSKTSDGSITDFFGK